MKIPLAEAARGLGIHPLNLLLYLGDQDLRFDDIWLDIDASWLDAVKARDWQRFKPAPQFQPAPAARVMPDHSATPLSRTAGQILEKLWRQDRWGNNTVSVETIRKHYCPNANDTDGALRELQARDFIEWDGPRGPVSLTSALKAEIDQIARTAIAAGRKGTP